jgi:hypothetical protein
MDDVLVVAVMIDNLREDTTKHRQTRADTPMAATTNPHRF